MQLHISFSFNTIRLPLGYSHILQAVIYNALKKNPRYSRFLHDRGYGNENSQFKLFTFSSLQGKFFVENNEVVLSDRAMLEVRSCDPYFIQVLFESMKPESAVRIGRDYASIDSVRLDDTSIFSPSCTIKTITPITVHTTLESGYTRYFNPSEDSFYRAVEMNAYNKWRSYFNDAPFDFYFGPSDADTSVTKQLAHYKGFIVEGYRGLFQLEGDPAVLSFLYNCGLGAKNSQGFGMFEPVPQT